MFLKNKSIIFKIKRSKVTDNAALRKQNYVYIFNKTHRLEKKSLYMNKVQFLLFYSFMRCWFFFFNGKLMAVKWL